MKYAIIDVACGVQSSATTTKCRVSEVLDDAEDGCLECKQVKTYIQGTPGYKNKLIFIDGQWLVKTNRAAFIFVGELGNKFLSGQF